MAKSYGRTEKGTGPEIPEIEDGFYPVIVKDVQDSVNTYGGANQPQYTVWFEFLDVVKPNGEPLTMPGFIKVPDGVINDGVLNENSKLYEFLRALGYTDDDLEIEPANWQGEELQVVVENKEIKEGDNKGQVRPRIKDYKPKKGSGRQQAQRAQQQRQPAAAGAGKSQSKDDF